MKVEILKPEDLRSYKELIDECFGSSNNLEQYQKYNVNKYYTVFVVKDGNEIAGSVTQYVVDLFTFSFQPCLMLFNIAVKPKYRRKNIGRTILEYIIENAKKEGYASISLTCLDNAYPAHKLYEEVGFVKAGSVKFEMVL